MQKIISLFKRDYEGNRQVIDEVVDGAEWVIDGGGIPTQKYDGTCCMVRDGKLFKRYTLKKGKTAPEGFEPATEINPITGKQEGWAPVGDGPEDAYHREAMMCTHRPSEDGTYELCGPKIQGNPEGLSEHVLVKHGNMALLDAPRTFDGLREWFKGMDVEGIVWWNKDGRMVKIKKKDFGLTRKQ